MAEGLVGGEGFAVDASLIRADANRQTGGPGSEGLPPDADTRAVREYLAVLNDAAFGAVTPVVPKFLAPATACAPATATSHRPATMSARTASFAIAPASRIAPAATCGNAAHPTCRPARSRAPSTKARPGPRCPRYCHHRRLCDLPSPAKKVEMLFDHLKRILKLDRLRLQGPNGAKDEFLLAATAQNLRKMAQLIPMPAQMAPV